MASPDRSQVLLLLNTTGRQSISIARAASAVGFSVRAHISAAHKSPLVAGELQELPHTTIFEGDLNNASFRSQLLHGVKLAFINTTSFDEEEQVGKAFVDLAKSSNVSHVIYSSMPDHSTGDAHHHGWIGLPQWTVKANVEKYALLTIADKLTVVQLGIYHNNFTSLPYPLFQLREVELGPHGEWLPESSNHHGHTSDNSSHDRSLARRNGNLGFEWCAPFRADRPLPWIDCEHDFGATILQIFKEGLGKWGGKRVPVASSYLTPVQASAAFEKALKVPVRYVEGPIKISVPIPDGYEKELNTLEKTLGGQRVGGVDAPYWWSGYFEPLVRGQSDDSNQHPGKGEQATTVNLMHELWPGWRSLEDYAGDAFIEEERFNGRTWMLDDGEEGSGFSAGGDSNDNDADDDEDGGLEMGSGPVMPL